ncbi:tyrosine-protein phosphatase [uncultured Treponema sp.]|uniref:tyrosine-protein phosphatase n=1 Tax=uncultured Treponema sp. TaxID=162155 RepID=UPI0025EDB13C|nr:tyrosine-protein phosphatase [uncultured Treponema sp.]
MDSLIVNQKEYKITQEDRQKCFIEDKENSRILFIFDHATWGQIQPVESAYVCGSFNSWQENEDFKMHYSPELNLHYLAVDFSKVSIIGNSGYPEYKFCINHEFIWLQGINFIPPGYAFFSSDRNLVIVHEGEDLSEVIKESNIGETIKSLSDFDLNTREGQEEISNFRLVPGTKKLFRCFHPFYSTGGRSNRYETEKTRIELVQKLCEEEGIKSDINLTDDYTIYAGEDIHWYDGTSGKVTIPDFYQKMLDSNSVCNVMSASEVVPYYDYVYTKPRGELFGEWVQNVVYFIIDDAHEAPFSIHCAIGTDRTGVFSALLGGLCGATWNEVAEDYQKTNRMGINEYRSKALLAQAFQNLLQTEDVSKIPDFQKALWDYFTTTPLHGKPILTEEEIRKIILKLD